MTPRIKTTYVLAIMLLGLDALALNGRGVAQDVDPAELVRDIHAIFGDHHARAVHAKGVVLEATFEPTEQARQLSTASAFAGKLREECAFRIRQAYPTFPMPTPMPVPSWAGGQIHAWRRLGDGFGYAQLQWLSRCCAGKLDTFLKAVAASNSKHGRPRAIEKCLQAHPNAVPFTAPAR